jgi:hypothetical protein
MHEPDRKRHPLSILVVCSGKEENRELYIFILKNCKVPKGTILEKNFQKIKYFCAA